MASEYSAPVATPSQTWLARFFSSRLLGQKSYHIDRVEDPIKLDQNEMPWDWPDDVKERVQDQLAAMDWNRYPDPYNDNMTSLVAGYAGVAPENVILSPGSNLIITTIIDGLRQSMNGDVVIAQPSFVLYENHCNYQGIPYKLWPLSDRFEYDLDLLPPLKSGSMVLFASPNNPVGNTLPSASLRVLLDRYSDCVFVADEAYFEFCRDPYTELLRSYPNLILVRTFSKALGAAGVRIGYALAGAATIDQLRKLRLPYLLNHFSVAALSVALGNPGVLAVFRSRLERVIEERQRVLPQVAALGRQKGFEIFPSEANFFLMRWRDPQRVDAFYKYALERGVIVRYVARAPRLPGCLRVTLGLSRENDFFKDLVESFDPNSYLGP